MPATYEVSAEVTFAASHQLRDQQSVPEPLHGHNFRVEAYVGAETLSELGLVVDFLDLERELREVVAPYDHRHLNDLPPFDALNPTTENLARFFHQELSRRLDDGSGRVRVSRIRVWEAPTYSATYQQ